MPENQNQTIVIQLTGGETIKKPVNADEVRRVVSQSKDLDKKSFDQWLLGYFNLKDAAIVGYGFLNESMLPPPIVKQWVVPTTPYTVEDLFWTAWRQAVKQIHSVVFEIACLDDEHGTTHLDDGFEEEIQFPEDLDMDDWEARSEFVEEYKDEFPCRYIQAGLDYLEGWGTDISVPKEDGDVRTSLDLCQLRLNELMAIATEAGMTV